MKRPGSDCLFKQTLKSGKSNKNYIPGTIRQNNTTSSTKLLTGGHSRGLHRVKLSYDPLLHLFSSLFSRMKLINVIVIYLKPRKINYIL